MIVRAICFGLAALAVIPAHSALAAAPDAAVVTAANMRTTMPVRTDPVTDCRQSKDLQRRITGCTVVIMSGEALADQLPVAYRNRGRAQFRRGRKDLAVEDFTSAIGLNHDDVRAYYNRGTAYHHLGEPARAVDDFDAVIRLDPLNASAYGNRGVALEAMGELERAIDSYDRSLRLNPDNPKTYNNRGNAWSRSGDRDRAIEDYAAALRVDPTYARAYYNRGTELCRLGKRNLAIEDFRRAISLGRFERRTMLRFLRKQGDLEASGADSAADSAIDPAAVSAADRVDAALEQWTSRVCIAPVQPEEPRRAREGRTPSES